ncbi:MULTISPECIES: TetR/AcrR family transcriptional regulator [unclassified Pseudomonas]|uniref:TetR/AcrR family transcriptional regulator n=1 Tax=unclassified Pseudomonas TaxID=196821 RepID=UPI00244867B8|nr:MULTISPECIES: TetR/AcrR family transcriptional regulator [unclassified Pseudomonas]MDG9928632.1 TetR/AcrR family transcriptional regulator [Pseudomonas sp. GD04042]MDH0484921.1 TetR/AcrR family transcriptional regulator [Pseudomonas sp. GD04015]MDH0606912.1 TetR/AcrR family transcriptional regulator [Pseudomonas sp. GD03869]
MNRQPRTPRAPGRPAADATVQRTQLLDIATDLFAHQGIQATRLRTIAEHAGVTPALLNYYFGNKEGLIDAMVEERFMPLVANAAEGLRQAGDEPMELVGAFIRDMSRNVAEHPWVSQLWVREILCEGGVLRERLMDRVAPLVPLLLAQRFAAAQARGALNPELDPRLLVVSLIGLTLLPYAAAPIWRGVFANAQIGDDALITHTLALLRGAMEP